jgi:membrane-associated protease RseP (regulator of RpoE activity)
MAADDKTETNDATTETNDDKSADETGEAKPSRLHRTVAVPGWLAGVLAALVLLGAGFAIGWYSAPGGHDHRDGERAAMEGPGGRPDGGRPDGGRFPNRPPGLRRPGPGNVQRPGVPPVILGVAAEDATGTTTGARITQVLPGGPADTAGLRADDIVTAVDNTKVDNAAALARAIRSHSSGDSVTIHFRRGSDDKTVDVKLGAPADSSEGQNASPA